MPSDYEDWEEEKFKKRRRRPQALSIGNKMRRSGEPTRQGLVVLKSRGLCQVLCEQQIFECRQRGRLLRTADSPRQVVVGDRVTLRISDSRQGVIEEILPRSNLVTRVSETEPFKTRVMAANLDALGIILAIEPFPPRWVLADRMLVLAEQENLMAFIVINKIDLLDPRQDRTGEVRSQAEVYQKLGVAICWTSALRGDGMERLESLLKNRLTAFAGHSGVGKTSLLNRLVPEIHLEVAGVNPLTLKGRQTTTTSRLVSLKCGGYIVDTPGFREFGLGRIQAAELGRFFPEFRPVISQCRFSDCLHQQEPGCALVPAVEQGLVSKLRYQNYLQILSGLVEPSS